MYYTVIILSLERFKPVFDRMFPSIISELGPMPTIDYETEKENVYDWIVTNSIMNYVQGRTGARVYNHYRQDIYKCVYDRLKSDIDYEIISQFEMSRITLTNTETLKVMVTGHSVLVAKGFSS